MRQLIVTVPASRSMDVVQALQEECELKNVVRFEQDNVAQISCYVSPEASGLALHELDKIGCGTAYGKIALMPVSVLKPLHKSHVAYKRFRELFHVTKWTVSARMACEEIYASIDQGTVLSFDYVALIVVAGWIAAIGLGTNNAVMIVASMLLSPLMGPLMAITLGTAVGDWPLVVNGLVVELVGIVTCILVGVFWGLIGTVWHDVVTTWPTNEMSSRGDPKGLIAGLLFALPSGAGVGLCATGGGSTALVGVAIAASLLPPLVNSGMLFAYAIMGAPHNEYDAWKFHVLAGTSLALFVINVVCIWFTGVLVYYLKRVGNVRRQLLGYKDLPSINTHAHHNSGVQMGAMDTKLNIDTDLVHDSSLEGASSFSPTDRFRVAAAKVINTTKGGIASP